jgi:predicted kinase
VFWLECQAETAVIRERLQARRGDASDADWKIHQEAAARWESPAGKTRQVLHPVNTNGSVDDVTRSAMALLRSQELF